MAQPGISTKNTEKHPPPKILDSQNYPQNAPKIPKKYPKIPKKCAFLVFFGIFGVFSWPGGYFFGIFRGNSGSGHLGALSQVGAFLTTDFPVVSFVTILLVNFICAIPLQLRPTKNEIFAL